jgi:hypothetical protein
LGGFRRGQFVPVARGKRMPDGWVEERAAFVAIVGK